MAARLTVIMVHSPPANAAAQGIAESVVGEIIGRPGIDLTLVGPLDQIAPQSTDLLTLQGITGDVAVMDWRTSDDLVQKLNETGFPGVRAPHADDQEPPSPPIGQRRIYAFDLNQTTDAKQLCVALNNLLAERQVRTFTLGGVGSQVKSTAKPTASLPLAKPQPQKAPSQLPESQPESRPEPQPESSANQRANESTSINLDDLVDQLDQLDP